MNEATTFFRRALSLLRLLDDAEAHIIASNGQCARGLHWERGDTQTQVPECNCELGAVILALSDALGEPCARYRHKGRRFGERKRTQERLPLFG